MRGITRSRWEEMEDDPGLLAHETLGLESYNLPQEEDPFVFCPECGEMAESFVFIEHKGWCMYGEQPAPSEV